MDGVIYKAAPSLETHEVLSVIDEYNDIPEYADVFDYKDFMEQVSDLCITDYDGAGELILNGKVAEGTSLWISNRSVHFKDKLFVPFDVIYNLFGDAVQFAWYNK